MRRLVLALAACLTISPIALPAQTQKPPKVKKHTSKAKGRKAPKVKKTKHTVARHNTAN